MTADVFYFGGMAMIVLILASLMFLELFLALVGAARRKIALRGSQAATIAILNARREREKTTASRRELETSSFEAYTHCGGCGKLDYHPMREPKPISPEYAEALEKLDRHVELVAWGGDLVRSIVDQRMPRVRETDFDVIRTCSSCSHEWGQR